MQQFWAALKAKCGILKKILPKIIQPIGFLFYVCNRLVTQAKPSNMRRDVFQAIADPTRREIIGLLAQKPLNINAVADRFPTSRAAISKHLKILTECGLVVVQQQGRERICEAQPEKLREVGDWVAQYRQFLERKTGLAGAVP